LAARSEFIQQRFGFVNARMSNSNKQTTRRNRAAKTNGGGAASRPAKVGVQSQFRRALVQRKRGLRPGAGKQESAAAAYASSQKTGQAQIFRTGPDSCRIIHRELVASVTGSVVFTVGQSLPLNPGMQITFPWLSIQALGWERYKWNALRFCYYTRTGSNIPGSVMMAPDYDAADAAPGTEVGASSYQDTQEDAPWKDITCVLKRRELMGDMKEKYIRSGALAANQDIKTYDAGNFFLCTVDGTAVPWGKLWVEYDVTLITPQVPAGGFASVGVLSGGGAFSAAAPFGTAPVNTGGVQMTVAGQVVTFPNVGIGQELYVGSFITGTVITVFGATAPANMAVKSDAAAGGVMKDAGSLAASEWVTFLVSAANPSFTMSTTATTVTGGGIVAAVLAPIPTL
jgi:hypothetical protein